jgi:hypothetical protein
MNKKLILFFLLGIFFLNFVFAYDLGAVKKDECADLYQHCSDCSFVNVTSIKYPNQTIIYLNVEMEKRGYDFIYNYCGNNQSGDYFYTVCGDPTDKDPCKTFSYLVTESGLEMSQARTTSTLSLIGLLLIFLVLSIIGLFKVEDYRGKFALYWISHLFLILIFFVGWQIGVEGLLSGTALTGIFRILFWVTIVSAFPMVLLSLAWVFYVHTMNDHVKRLIEKGEDPETAFSMAQKKTKRGKKRW